MNPLLPLQTACVKSILIVSLALFAASAHAQTVKVDFSQPADPPLVKTKFGVYQTPLTTLPRLLDSVPLLREINVADLRYEIGWGKPESLAALQIGGTARQPRYNFSVIDAFTQKLNAAGVKPLLAMSYCPAPLKSRGEWAGWKDMPSDLGSWQRINRDYAFHLSKLRGTAYEIWNEPDMPEPGGKMFFSGTPQDYGQLYAHAAGGIRQGDPDALVGGPAAAWNLAYLAPILSQPLDFASIHGYDNYGTQLSAMRAALAARPDVPIFLSEYASFTDFPPNGPQSRHPGAMRFFRDVKGLLTYPDVTKVYWAQWLDAGDGPGMGLISWDGHRKALFNAFKLYGAMPVDRVATETNDANGINALASSDKHHACVVLWNESATARQVRVNLQHLPFAQGTLRLLRIDRDNASYVDDPASENLRVLQTTALRQTSTDWKGTVPAESVVFLDVRDGSPAPRFAPALGTYLRSYGWFPDRTSSAYADFDARTWTARLGMGESDFATAQIGVAIENPALRWRVQVEKSGSFRRLNQDSLFGVRLDFPSATGSYKRSVLFHSGLYDPQRSATLPWGKGGNPDRAMLQRALNTSRAFDIDLRRIAPLDWDRRRVLVTFLLRNAGRGSRAKLTLTQP